MSEEQLRAHQFQVEAVAEGYFWICPCGESSGPVLGSMAAAESSAHMHLRETVGFGEHPDVTEQDCFTLLAALDSAGRAVDPHELNHVGTHIQVMDALGALHRRQWIEIAKPLYGDNRLLSAHGVSLSSKGKAAYQDAMLRAVDIVMQAEPDHDSAAILVEALPNIDAKRAARAQFMKLLYERVDGSPAKQCDSQALGRDLKWSQQVTVDVVRYLVDEGLIKRTAWGGLIAIMHAGVREVEQLLTEPSEPTAHFPPLNIVYIAGDNSGQVQTGTTNSQQTQNIEQVAAIGTFLTALREVLPEAVLEPATKDIVQANIELVSDMLAQEGPTSPVVKRVLPTLRDIAIGIASNGAFVGLAEAISRLPF